MSSHGVRRFKTVFGVGSEASGAIVLVLFGASVQFGLLVGASLLTTSWGVAGEAISAVTLLVGLPLAALLVWRRTGAEVGSGSVTGTAVLGVWLIISVALLVVLLTGRLVV